MGNRCASSVGRPLRTRLSRSAVAWSVTGLTCDFRCCRRGVLGGQRRTRGCGTVSVGCCLCRQASVWKTHVRGYPCIKCLWKIYKKLTVVAAREGPLLVLLCLEMVPGAFHFSTHLGDHDRASLQCSLP